MHQNNDKLFSTFPEVSTSEWEAHIMVDLKGADYHKKLIWKTPDGFEVKPYYRAEDIEGKVNPEAIPGEYPFIRGNHADSNSWEIRQDIETDDLKEANRLAKDAFKRGATGVSLVTSMIESAADLDLLLSDLCPSDGAFHFVGSTDFPALVKLLITYGKKEHLPMRQWGGSFDFDPLSVLLLNGDFDKSEHKDLAQITEMVKLGMDSMPHMKIVNVNGHYYNSAGATSVQELGFSLASGNEYLALAAKEGLSVDDIAQRMMFSFAVGSSYFIEIAKLRAARLLWAKIVEQYKPQNQKSMQMSIHCNTSAWNKTLYDPYINILRTTTEAMSAVLGGTQSLSILPFDTFFKDPDEISNRIARNQQIILKEECNLDKVIDPGAGSYYIENLTQLIAEAAWNLFLQLEEKGGMLAAIKEGFVQNSVENSAGHRIQDIANRRIIQLGTNQYPNLEEQMLDKIHFSEEEELLEEEMYADEDAEVDEGEDDDEPTKYKKLILFGGSDAFDQLRLATEQYQSEGGKRPTVFLFNIGNLAMRKARAMFTTNFFGCAGFDILDNAGFATVEEGVQAAVNSKAEIAVICSSDEEYTTLGIEIAHQLKTADPEMILVVAGFPKDAIEALKNAGIEEFIHVRSNLVETLEKFQEKLGIF